MARDGDLSMLRRTSSPQCVAHVAEHVASFYGDDFAKRLLVLPSDGLH